MTKNLIGKLMNEIKFSVKDENLEIILTILENLKDGLISDLSTNSRHTKSSPTQYKPKVNTIIREENSGTNDVTGKYVNANAYRQRLKDKK